MEYEEDRGLKDDDEDDTVQRKQIHLFKLQTPPSLSQDYVAVIATNAKEVILYFKNSLKGLT
ncbi:hypothetical protein RYX36_037203 [Vicia faba]